MNVQKRIKKIIKKRIKEKQKQGELSPCTVSLIKWCESYGNSERFDWIRNLILTEADENEKESEDFDSHIYISTDLYDIGLDSIGITIYWKTLIDFFGKEEVQKMLKYIRARDKEEEIIHDIKGTISKSSDDTLAHNISQFAKIKENAETAEVINFVTRVLEILQTEQKRRNKKIFK